MHWILTGVAYRASTITPSYVPQASGFRLGFQQVNQAPTDLNSTAALSISENQPVGTIVGEFNATDPGEQ